MEYNILFDYFQGSINHRNQILKEKSSEQLEIERIEAELKDHPWTDFEQLSNEEIEAIYDEIKKLK